MTDQEKLIQLIETGEQCNIDIGVYQWLAQGFNKTELIDLIYKKVENWQRFDNKQITIIDYKITSKSKITWHPHRAIVTNNNYSLIKETAPILSQEALRVGLRDHLVTVINRIAEELAKPT